MKNKRTILILIILVLAGIVFYFVYQNFLVKAPEISLVPLLKIKTEFALEILGDPKFTDLRMYGKLPVVVSQKGKVNPFMKF